MTNASGLVQHDVAAALERALREHGGSGGANQETAAMRGVIDFLKKYMKHGGKTTAGAKGGGAKMRGEAATLALQAIAFANQCGGVEIKFNTDGQDVEQEDEDGGHHEDQEIEESGSELDDSELDKLYEQMSDDIQGED